MSRFRPLFRTLCGATVGLLGGSVSACAANGNEGAKGDPLDCEEAACTSKKDIMMRMMRVRDQTRDSNEYNENKANICPPDREQLGRASWTLVSSISVSFSHASISLIPTSRLFHFSSTPSPRTILSSLVNKICREFITSSSHYHTYIHARTARKE